MSSETMVSNTKKSVPIVEVKNLKKYFPIRQGIIRRHAGDVKAVDDISFLINPGETLGLVGESGCGKSTAGRTILRLYEKTAGEIYYKGQEISMLSNAEMHPIRKEMQIIFQDPYSSLNPRMSVSQIVSEGMKAHGMYESTKIMKEKVEEVIETCGLAKYHINRYPHQFSGGQRQRIGIARALALNPEFIVCDEPVSALDVSIQSQIINLMMDLQQKMSLSYLFISHDLSVVKHISDRIGVMYLGSMVELANKNDLYNDPKHPYTQALLSAIPLPDPKAKKEAIILEGDIPSNVTPPSGCKFHTRCPIAKDICKEIVPEYKNYGNNHFCACHFAK